MLIFKINKGAHPQFSAHVYCVQTAGWIKVPLGTEVGLDPSDIVLDGDPAPPPQKGDRAPNFRSMSIVAKQLHASVGATCMEVGLGSGHIVIDGDPAPSSKKEA